MGTLRSSRPNRRRRVLAAPAVVPLIMLLAAGCGDSMLGPDEDPAIDEQILVARSLAGDQFHEAELGRITPGGSGFQPMGIALRSPLIAVTVDQRRVALMTSDFTNRTMNADGSGLAVLSAPSGSAGPMWSPDGSLISLQDVDAVYVVPSGGGDAVDVSSQATASDGVCPQTGRTVLRSFGFAGDGHVLFNNYVCGVGDHFHRVSPDGTHASPHSGGDYDPERTYWSPDGTRILSEDRESIYLMNADGSARRTLHEGGGALRTLPSRFFARSNPWSPDGGRVAFTSTVQGSTGPARVIHVVEVDGPGSMEIEVPMGTSAHLSWSPSGRWLAFQVIIESSSDLFVADLEDGTMTNLTNSPDNFHFPMWVRLR